MRAVIYTRVSSDTAGHGRSVSEQETECRAICARENWPVAEVLTDNDTGASRHSRKDRPAYRRLTEVLTAGDVLVTWEASRAQRDLAAYVQLRDLCTTLGVLWSYGGATYDLSTGDGRFTTGLHALLSENEADKTRERVLRAFRANAAEGRPHGKIPYGYRAVRDPDTGQITKRIPDEAEAAVIADAARRVLEGVTPWRVAQDLNGRQVPTPGGAQTWTGRRLSLMLARPTYAGLRSHHGAITAGKWEPIISIEDHHRLVALFDDPTRRTQRGVAPVHLLSGIAKCGVCGARMERIKNSGYESYTCSSPGRHTARRITHVDELVTEVILFWCGQKSGPDDLVDPGVAQALDVARALRVRLDDAADQYADGAITSDQLARITAKLKPKIVDAERRGRSSPNPLVADLLGAGARARWDVMSVEGKRAVVRALVSVVIRPAPRGRVFKPEFVLVEWL